VYHFWIYFVRDLSINCLGSLLDCVIADLTTPPISVGLGDK
jgi:hypothetical protein